MKKAIAYIRGLFGKEESVDSIMAPLTKITTKLAAHEASQIEKGKARNEAATKALQEAHAADEAAKSAAAKRERLAAFA